MSCCRRSRVVDVEVAGQGDVAVVDGVVVVDDEATQSWRCKKKCAMTGLQTWTVHLADVRGCRRR